MNALPECYQIDQADSIESPGIVVFKDLLLRNIKTMIAIAGSPERLRPHCKTHKTREVIRLLHADGITRHKCATLAEAEMLLNEGATDVFVAYQLVGPNIDRFRSLIERFPAARLAVAIDHPDPLAELSKAVSPTGREIDALLDLNSGMNRTGIEIGRDALQLYEAICGSPGIRPGGLHWYDGHIRQSDLTERTVACRAGWERLICFRDALLLSGLPVPRIVAAGTGSFPVLAEVDEPGLELSAGTVVYWDANYRRLYPDLPFIPALGILTRVVSCNRSGYLTLDLGHKACAADPPAGQRLEFPAWPDAREVMHHEEHLVVETRSAGQWRNGDWTIALPAHVCPTSALHEHATVISGRRIVERWRIAARTRELMSADET